MDKIEVYKFGIDLSFWKFKSFIINKRDYILTIGNDMNRDYTTLLDSLSGKYKIIAITNRLKNSDNCIIKTN